jgi:putative heme-binding domain-containing protein
MSRCLLVALCLTLPSLAAAAERLELKKGDHICIIGNTLAERMQHDGWLETLITARFPEHDLVFRNLGYSGDEIDGWENPQHRMRSMDFGTFDQWLTGSAPVPQPTKLSSRDQGKVREDRFELTNTKADVIFAFYGYNESFAGEAGLPKFRENVARFIDHVRSQKYNGKSAPRLVLFSPIAQEYLPDPNLPSREAVAASNARIKLYADALREVAAEKEVPFVDLFTWTTGWTASAERPLTFNGIHLTELGDFAIAGVADQALFGDRPYQHGGINDPRLNALRTAINEKNFYWFNRYRITDGYSTYGDRAFLKFAEGPGGYGDGLSNYSVGQRELEALDVLTANRDQHVWSVAKGKPIAVKDDNLPYFLEVISNKPGPLDGGKHLVLGGEEAISKMTVHQGMTVSLFASEAEFPELVNPVQMAFDTKGRLWVATWVTYPHWQPTTPMADKLLILEDTTGDGKADVCKTFAGDLHNPTGFEFWNNGVLVAQGPDIVFLKDTDGDDKYDVRERIVHGLDTADTHHTANSFVLDPGGAMYFQEGTFHHSQVESPWGPPRRVANGAVFRYEPRSQKFDVYVSFPFANPHGHVFDQWGQDIVVDGTGAVPYHGPLISSHLEFPAKHGRPPTVYQQRTRPCSSIEILSSSHFPEEFRGNLLVANVIGFQGILNYKLEGKDSSLGATEQEPIVYSSDPNFRPADIEVGPDGAIYFTDWQNPIIGHMQHNLRDPSRDKTNGRVYKVTYDGRPLLKPEPIFGQPIPRLIELLKHPDDRLRYRARIELTGRPTEDVIAAAKSAYGNGQIDEHFALELLWLHQSHNVVQRDLLERVLKSPDFRARAAAVRVLAAWHDRVPNALDLLRQAAMDDAGRVRLMAVWASSFIHKPESIEVVLIAAEKPSDQYHDFLSKEVLRTLEPITKQALANGQRIPFATEAGARYFLRNLSNEQLLKEARHRPVYLELLYRPGLLDEQRREAVEGLAKLDNKSQVAVVMDAIRWLDEKEANADIGVVFDLVRQLTGRSAEELSAARSELEKLALSAKQPAFRQIGFASLISVDDSVEPAWTLATKDAKSLQDFVAATPLISDPGVRAGLYPRLEALLHGLPEHLAATTGKGSLGRYVRVEIPGRATLTLAEVEVYSGGENVARRGRASQKNTSHGGDASRAIDGNTNGSYGAGGQTHTEELTGNQYWEVDLGGEVPIDKIVIYNRTDGDLGNRLSGFTLRVLDNRRNDVVKLTNLPTPRPRAEYELAGGGPSAQVRRAAMAALPHIRGKESETFRSLAKFVADDADRLTAIRSLQRLPKSAWPREMAPDLIQVLTASLRKTPVKERTAPAALDTMEFADALASLLPAEQAKGVRLELRELGVRVVRIGTVFEKMAYDKDAIAVRAGKPVEFVFENSDLMPHNLVITQPGALEEIGLLSEADAQKPEHAARQYVPQSNKILLASKLLQPRDVQQLSFTAPTQPGVYPIVCTYPGHWRRMYAALYVVEDLDAYEAAPEAYLALNKIEAVDALLKDRRPRTEWSLADLAEPVAAMKHGRDFATGKAMFTVASCIGCHRLDGVGNQFGAELTKLDPKVLAPAELLKHILEPSLKIDEKFRTTIVSLTSGQTVSGLVVEETPEVLKLVENPLISAQPRVIKKSEIDERVVSQVSIMPKGLLDKLTREEILDLIAFVSARGDKAHKLFHKDGHHHH